MMTGSLALRVVALVASNRVKALMLRLLMLEYLLLGHQLVVDHGIFCVTSVGNTTKVIVGGMWVSALGVVTRTTRLLIILRLLREDKF